MGEFVRSGQALPDIDAALSSVRLSEFGLRREPPRPPHKRPPDYEALFDFDTLYYDVFREGGQVVCIGPPLLGCEEAISALTFRLPRSEFYLAKQYRPSRTHFQPTHRVYLSGEGLPEAQCLVLELGGTSIEVPIRPSGRSRFAGRQVITTMSKNNPLDWIHDWAAYNVRVHGADAVILYDNGSTEYAPADICERLRMIGGLAEFLVVPWSFPIGPTVGPGDRQDSFYGQPGQLDHVRRRYCGGACAVLNTDIDELVVTPPGETIFARAERSGRAAVVFAGVWVEAVGSKQDFDLVRHTDCRYWRRVDRLRRLNGRFAALSRRLLGDSGRVPLRRRGMLGGLLRTKWIAVPSRCGDGLEWGVHDLHGGDSSENRLWSERPEDILFRHFRQLNVKRWRRKLRRYSLLRYGRDRRLEAAFAIAFPEQRRRPIAGSERKST